MTETTKSPTDILKGFQMYPFLLFSFMLTVRNFIPYIILIQNTVIGFVFVTPTEERYFGKVQKIWVILMLSMKLEYLKTSSNVVQYLESLILVPKNKSTSSDWNKRFYLKGDVLRSGTLNLVLLCQNRQIHGNLLWKPRQNRKWCLLLYWSKYLKWKLEVVHTLSTNEFALYVNIKLCNTVYFYDFLL